MSQGARLIVTGRLDQRSWETQEGDKRSKVEIIADEVGPSLRWATAQVSKNERKAGDGGGFGGGGGGQQRCSPRTGRAPCRLRLRRGAVLKSEAHPYQGA